MGWELIIIGVVGLVLFRNRWQVLWHTVVGPRCPECRQARLSRMRDLGEEWGNVARYSTCPACRRHFRHDADGPKSTEAATLVQRTDVRSTAT